VTSENSHGAGVPLSSQQLATNNYPCERQWKGRLVEKKSISAGTCFGFHDKSFGADDERATGCLFFIHVNLGAGKKDPVVEKS